MRLRTLFMLVLCVAAGAAIAQPTGAFLSVTPGFSTNHGYVQLPSSSSLNFSGGSWTFEAWVAIKDDAGGCVSIAGNGYRDSQWVGICGTTLRSYTRGVGTFMDGGTVPENNFTHIAVTFDQATLRHAHYIDGELVQERTEPSGITPAVDAWRIFSDADYERTPSGSIDEVRFWNVARTLEQIRANITNALSAPQTGLVAVYALDASANATVGGAGLNGTRVGAGGYLAVPITAGCVTGATQLCIGPSGRFALTATYNTSSSVGNVAQVVTSLTTPESGLFWFFGANNWEVMVKVLNGCALNNRKWVFASATTDQHFELVVTDLHHGIVKRYFNYAGPPAPAIIDVDALATCP